MVRHARSAPHIVVVAALVFLLVGVGMAAGVGQQEPTAVQEISLTYWVPLNANPAATAKDFNDVPFFQELEKRTGVKVDYIHPPAGQDTEQFNLMVASGDLPDIVERTWARYPGGPLKAIADGVIIDHTELITEHAPNLVKYLQANPAIQKMVSTDDSKYYTFPFIYGDDFLLVYYGLQIRQDWLQELHLAVPETIDDWYAVLKAFREKKNVPHPFSYVERTGGLESSDAFISAYGVRRSFYLDGGKVLYGAIEPGYRQFLATFAKWFTEGLLDKDFAAQDDKTFDAKVTSDEAGAWVGYAGSHLLRYLQLMAEKNPRFDIVGAPNPVLLKGEKPFCGQRDNAYPGSTSASITTKNRYPQQSAEWLDYAYGEEGHMLFNFGIEGVSYTVIDGYPTYTAAVMKNPDGLSVGQAMAKWSHASYGGPCVRDRRYFEQYVSYPQQLEAVRIWSNTDAALHRLPPTTLSPEESSQYANIMNQVNTFMKEWFLKFVMNQKPLEEFDAYVAELNKMGIQQAIAVQQAALDRYNRR